MKKLLFKRRYAFSVVIMMFCILPQITNAQKHEGRKPPQYCNCFVRPIPFKCGQICGFLTSPAPVKDDLSLPGVHSNAITFSLIESQNVSLKIYDASGRLVKTLANSRMPQGDHEIVWNKKDDAGNTVMTGLYTLQFDAGNYSVARKLPVIN